MAGDLLVKTPYASAVPFMAADVPSWLDEYNAQRLASYDLYDDMYDNAPDTIALMLRGSDEQPIYVPTPKRLVNTLCRYVGKNWGYSVAGGTGSERTAAMEAFSSLFAREELEARYTSGKRRWLARGDWVWYVRADPEKEAGSRISIDVIDPRMYFPITAEEDPDKVLGAMLVEEFTINVDGRDPIIALKVQRWLKPNHPESPAFGTDETEIAHDSRVWDLAEWQNPERRKLLTTLSDLELLPGITAIPLYHIKNGDSTQEFGESEYKGIESIFAGINQSISDEDLALAMAGLGMYHTDGGAPVDEDGNPTNWILGPQRVVETGTGKKFERVSGVASVEPVQVHVKYLEEQAYGSSGINEIALGTRGSVQESGVALAIRMQPLFDAADDKDAVSNAKLTQMFYDLTTMWFPQYEPEMVDFTAVTVTSVTDPSDRLPFDREARWTELVSGYEAGILPLSFIHRKLNEEFGFDLTPAELGEAIEAVKAKAAAADPFGARVEKELSAENEDDEAETDGGE